MADIRLGPPSSGAMWNEHVTAGKQARTDETKELRVNTVMQRTCRWRDTEGSLARIVLFVKHNITIISRRYTPKTPRESPLKPKAGLSGPPAGGPPFRRFLPDAKDKSLSAKQDWSSIGPSMQLQMNSEIAAQYRSASQRVRVMSELWAEQNLYCANCYSGVLVRSRPNTEAIDFKCPDCGAPFQLKSQGSRFGSKIVDAAYGAMQRAILENRTPNLIALHYELKDWRVMDVFLVPRFAFSISAIEKRKPLAVTARRAGWIGCNILLRNIPDDAKIELVRAGVPISPNIVRGKYSRLKPLGSLNPQLRGWTLDVLKIARSVGKEVFTLGDIYGSETELQRLYPSNRHVRPKIRQQLQQLRDLGIIEFLRPGEYKFTKAVNSQQPAK